jgi:hypothetical protein
MKKTTANITLFFVALALMLSTSVRAANPSVVVNVFNEVSANIKVADVEKLAERFDKNVELQLPAAEKSCPAAQAATLIKEFFAQNKPVSYSTLHVGGKDSKHYGIGLLVTPNGRFRTTIFLQVSGKDYVIQQLRIENDR